MSIERCILRGRPLLLENCGDVIDSMITPLIQHQNTQIEEDPTDTDDGTVHLL